MNRQETLQVLQLLDECIDHAEHMSVMLALDSLRRALLQFWQQGLCQRIDGARLLAEIGPLPSMCRAELHPALPMQMSQTVFCLYSPEADPVREPLDQCRDHAEKLRSLYRWQAAAEGLLALYDEEVRQDAQQLMAHQMDMMSDVFVQLLTITRSCMAAKAAQHRVDRLKEIVAIRDSLCLEEEIGRAHV